MFSFPTGFFEMKMKYDESDNALIRASRAVTDRVTDFLGNALSYIILILFSLYCNNSVCFLVLTYLLVVFVLRWSFLKDRNV